VAAVDVPAGVVVLIAAALEASFRPQPVIIARTTKIGATTHEGKREGIGESAPVHC
jgi:hypothetical protein